MKVSNEITKLIKNNAINKVILSFQDRMNFSQAYSLEIKQMEIKEYYT